MYKQLLVVCIFAVFTLFIKRADSIQCFVCNSHHNKSCTDPFNAQDPAAKVYLTDCSSVNGILCRKITQSVGEDYRVIRKCGWEAERKDRPSYTLASDLHKANYYNCDQDLCNSSDKSHYSSVLIAFSMVFALMRLVKSSL